MNKNKLISGEMLIEKYLERVFESNVDLEDSNLEEEWLRQFGWTSEEFEMFLHSNIDGGIL